MGRCKYNIKDPGNIKGEDEKRREVHSQKIEFFRVKGLEQIPGKCRA